MATTNTVVELVKDVWNFGCKGDVITVTKEALAKLDELGEKAGAVYKKFVDAASRAGQAVEGEIVADVNSIKANSKGAVKTVVADGKADATELVGDAKDTASEIAADSSIK